MKGNILRWTMFTGLVILALTIWISPVAANGEDNRPTPNCLNCHENLYFNYDTGKYYCVSEASERCVNCHGGDPEATTMEAAHINTAHPIVMGDVSKCAECHVDDCAAHVQKFETLAGVSEVINVAVPITPSAEIQELSQPQAEPGGVPFSVLYLSGMGLLIIGFSAGALVYQVKCNKKQKS